MADSKSEKSKLHTGHRQRVRKKFIEEGNLDAFSDNEVLEFLLFYAYSRRDTNEIAHKLLDKYDSLYNIFNSKPVELMQDTGLTEPVAVLLSLIPHIFRRCLISKYKGDVYLDTYQKTCSYMQKLAVGKSVESFFVISLDAQKRVIDVDEYSDSAVDFVNIGTNMRSIIGKILSNKAAFVVIGHNHPSGVCKPSSNDMIAAQKFIELLMKINVTVLDNVIITDDETYSFLHNKKIDMIYKSINK